MTKSKGLFTSSLRPEKPGVNNKFMHDNIKDADIIYSFEGRFTQWLHMDSFDYGVTD